MNGAACDRVQLLLAEWIAGELDDVRGADVRAHLQACAACRAEEAQMREVLALLEEDASSDGLGGVPDPGERYWSSFAGRVRTARAARSLAPSAGRSWLAVLVPRLSVAVAAAVLAYVAAVRPPAVPAADPDAELLAELLAPPAAEVLDELDTRALDSLEEALASAPVRSGATSPPPSPRPSRPQDAATGDPAPGAALDELQDLSPEQLERLLRELDALT